jgi:hypothetical protein
MTATQRVPNPPSRLAGHGGTLVGVVVIAIVAAIVKPWGIGSESPTSSTDPFASPSPSSSTSRRAPGHVFDPGVYGPFEPSPEWSIWPAGYFVSVKFVTRARGVDASPDPPTADANRPDAPRVSPSIDVDPSDAEGPNWPATVDIQPGEHLLWLGINTPRGWSVRDVALRRVAPGRPTTVMTRRLPSRWDDHFTIVGIPTAESAETLSTWPTGDYLLELVVDPGAIKRTIVVTVRTAFGADRDNDLVGGN